MASNTVKATFLIVWSLIDIAVSTLLYPQQFQHYRATFLSKILHYNIYHSMFDLWVCSLIRLAVILGVLFGYLRNTTLGVKRVQTCHYVIAVLAIIMWDFPIVKLLLMYNHSSDEERIFFWALFSWSLFASVIFYLNWRLLATFKSLRPISGSSRSLAVNATSEERRSLLDQDRSPEQLTGETRGSQDSRDIEPAIRFATVGRLLSYSKPDWPIVFVAFVFLLLSSAAQIFTPWYTGQVIEGIAIKRDEQQFVRSIIYMALFSAASSLAAGVRGGCFSLIISRLNIRIRRRLFSSLLNQEIGFFDVTQTGEITSRLTADTAIMSDTLGLNTNVFLRSIVTSVGVCVFMIRLSWQLSLVTLIGLPVILGASKIYGNYYEWLSKQIQDCQAKANRVADEVCSSMRTVRSFAGEESEQERYAQRLLDTYQFQKKEALSYGGYMWISELFALSLVVGTLYYGGILVINDFLSGGKLVSFILYQMQLGYELESIASVYTGLMQATGASEKVFEFIEREPRITNPGNTVSSDLKGRLDFQNVSFSYPSRPDTRVLKGVSFSVAPGEVVALVGPSGGGKTTCIGLLEHFYETAEGRVLLDGVPIVQYDHHFLHQKIALVGQEPVLYARSIQENIAYGLGIWNMDMVKKAAQMANAHHFVSELKDKYDTQAGEKGVQLSGGQKQRVAIARAVIRNPTVLLLDEATSALDAESEHVVQEAIYNNMKGRTVIVVAHRLSTVERATRIVVINKGVVVDQGTHKELLQRGGLYTKLVQRQLLGQDIGLSASDNQLDGEHRPSTKQRGKSTGTGAARQRSTGSSGYSPKNVYGSFRSVGSSSSRRNSVQDPVFQHNDTVNFQIGSPPGNSLGESPSY